ncbi:hypothetical protein AX16_000692 [Volvariella volvacea WC 439]|nr:hypothetical protein AX16_000692 [Volvariella volvacea WC 439]
MSSNRGRGSGRGRGSAGPPPGGSGSTHPHNTSPAPSGPSRGGFAPRGGFRGGDRGGRGYGGSRGRGGGGNVGGGHRDGSVIFNEGAPAAVPSHLSNDKLGALIRSYNSVPHRPHRPLRPGFGSAGAPSVVRANFFAVKHEGPIYDYTVTITQSSGKGSGSKSSAATGVANAKKRRLFKLLEQEGAIKPYITNIAHDYTQRLVSSKQLPQPLDLDITYYDEDEDKPKPNADTYLVSIKFERELKPEDSKSYLEGSLAKRDFDIQPYASATNLFLQQLASRTGVRVGKNRYFFQQLSQSLRLSTGIEAWKGFSISTRPSYGQLLVNVNVCWAAFVVPGNLADALNAFNANSRGAMPTLPKQMVSSIKVKLRHLGYHKKLFAIGTKTPRDTYFDCAEFGGQISVEQYFKKKYNIQLKFPADLPVVDVGTRAKTIWVPPELCDILPGCAYRGKLNDRETAQMIRYACNDPRTNFESIVNEGLPILGFKKIAGSNAPDSLAGFKLSVDPNPIVIPSRELPPPRISYKQGRADIRNGGWNILNVKFHRGARVNSWWVLVVQDSPNPSISSPDDPILVGLVNGFKNKCISSGMTMPAANPRTFSVQLVNPRRDPGRAESIRKLRELLTRQVNEAGRPDFVLVILENRDNFIYPALKRLGDVDLGVHTVHMQIDKATGDPRKQDQYFSNVALKVNAKLGGVNHLLDPSAMTWLTKKKTMLVGIDVTHRGPGSREGTPSIAAMVANTDDTFVQFPASLKLQSSNRGERPKEMVDDIEAMLIERLELYQKKNKVLPERVFVFRDGVSEGQFDIVLAEELKGILKAFANPKFKGQGNKAYRPVLSIIICGKRHHARMAPTDAQFADKGGNTRPGTVNDKGITAVYDFDFYLQSHAGIKGHAKGTHYTVVYDENKFTADEIQQGTHNASHLYARATRAVSLVPPAYYADLACERARFYLNNFFDANSEIASTIGSGKGKGKKRSREEEMDLVFQAAVEAWGQGLHPTIRDSMFYQ